MEHSDDEFDRLSIETQVDLMYRHLNIKKNIILVFLKKKSNHVF
jgi:hypothetical protein